MTVAGKKNNANFGWSVYNHHGGVTPFFSYINDAILGS